LGGGVGVLRWSGARKFGLFLSPGHLLGSIICEFAGNMAAAVVFAAGWLSELLLKIIAVFGGFRVFRRAEAVGFGGGYVKHSGWSLGWPSLGAVRCWVREWRAVGFLGMEAGVHAWVVG
jgi:hypothetical protein